MGEPARQCRYPSPESTPERQLRSRAIRRGSTQKQALLGAAPAGNRLARSRCLMGPERTAASTPASCLLLELVLTIHRQALVNFRLAARPADLHAIDSLGLSGAEV